MWIVRLLPQAEIDLVEGRDWYDRIDRQLGDRFLDEVAGAIRELEIDPNLPGIYYQNFRRILLRRFPYKLFYQVIGEQVIVFRVLHTKQCHERSLD